VIAGATTAGMDLFAPGAAATAVLLSLRLTGLVLIAPVFSAQTVPVMIRTTLVVLLTILIQPVAFANAHGIPQVTPATAIGELVVGFSIGLGAALLVGAAEGAGDLLATQIGLSGASVLDPLNNASTPVLSSFLSLFTVTVLLALNVHLGMLEALATSLRAIPVGSALDLPSGLRALLSLGSSLFVVGLRFAAPVVATVMIGNVALAVLSRAAPQLNILSVAFPLQIWLGLFALGIAVPFIAGALADWPAHYDHQLTTIFTALLPHGAR